MVLPDVLEAVLFEYRAIGWTWNYRRQPTEQEYLIVILISTIDYSTVPPLDAVIPLLKTRECQVSLTKPACKQR